MSRTARLSSEPEAGVGAPASGEVAQPVRRATRALLGWFCWRLGGVLYLLGAMFLGAVSTIAAMDDAQLREVVAAGYVFAPFLLGLVLRTLADFLYDDGEGVVRYFRRPSVVAS